MTRISVLVLIVAVTMASAPSASFAQSGASPRGTIGAGTAQSSGRAPNRKQGSGDALGTGHARQPDTPSGDAVINQENAILDRKLKSICRGC